MKKTIIEVVQLQTTKVNKLSISGTRFFGRNLMTVLKMDRQKELKNGVFMLFPWVFGYAKNLSKFFCILHCHLGQSLRKILLIKLIPITLCMSISSPESSALLASFFLYNWCDSWDLVISSSSSPSLIVWQPQEMMSLMEWNSRRVILEACKVAMYFRIGGQPLGLGSTVVIFFKGMDLFYFYFYWWILTILIEIYPKTTFSRFYQFFWACTKILGFFSDKSSLLGNRFISFKRSTQFLPILMVFGLLKKIPTSLNKLVNIFVDFSCLQL